METDVRKKVKKKKKNPKPLHYAKDSVGGVGLLCGRSMLGGPLDVFLKV